MREIRIQDIDGFRLGHAHNEKAATGCTVILCPKGAIAGVDVRGGAPGTRETDLLRSENLVQSVHGIFLAGGSAFGIDTGAGVMEFLEERKIGFDVSIAKVPIVPGAILFDLNIGSSDVRPDQSMGYIACQQAYKDVDFEEGNVGAGTGATVGKVLGMDYAMKGGIGSYAVQVGELEIGATVAVNSFGDIIDPLTGEFIAGAYNSEEDSFIETERQLLQQFIDKQVNHFSGNTSIGTIITNAALSKADANKISSVSHDGFARTMRPSHTMVDGDTLFTLSTNLVSTDLTVLCMLAVDVVEKAVVRAIKAAHTEYGVVAFKDIKNSFNKLN